ncbi:MAG: signal peptide peptidase SppA [bacterium]|nr:signal peptide peptidase SppA [bacterium]
MAKARDIVIGVIIAGSFLLFLAMILLMFFLGSGSSDNSEFSFGGLGSSVAIVNLYGVIDSPTEVVRQLDRWGEDESVKAIVIHINSPGGGVAASQEIYEKVLKVKRETDKPIIASMESVCASGGYYVAAACDQIVADPGTITGSIGVIFQYPIVEEMFNKVGIQYQTIKSGGRKDIGSPFRKPTESDSVVFQAVVDDTYHQFVDVIVANRNLPRDEVLRIADGSIFSGRQAQQIGLVDSLGTFEDAVDLAGELSGLGADPDRVREVPRRGGSIFDLIEGLLHLDISGLIDKNQGLIYPQLRYIFN